MAALLQVQQLCPIINTAISDCFVDCPSHFGSYWLDVTRINHSIPRSDFSPVDYNSSYTPYPHQLIDGSVIVSSTLHESRPGAKFNPPFATGASFFEKEPGLSAGLLIWYDGTQNSRFLLDSPSFCNNVAYTTYQSWTNESYGFFEARMQNLFTTLQHGNLANSLYQKRIHTLTMTMISITIDNGLGTFAVWINGTKPSVLGYNGINSDSVAPNVSFPFKRLASITSPGQKSSCLYHQINGTTVAEEHYDSSLTQWLSTYITLPNA